MQKQPERTVVVTPDNKKIEVSFYCNDINPLKGDKKEFSDVIIQMEDCHTSIKVPLDITVRRKLLEAAVQKKVINDLEYLCD